ncbi:hypothetical protein TNCV_2572941 [Trichonephila clavipes]|nr:hypothetical protein TNCV_2572941 [Trichonephila clavipes]
MIPSSFTSSLEPDKSRQDYQRNRKICHESKRMNFKILFRTSDCIENDTTMDDDSFLQESPVSTARQSSRHDHGQVMRWTPELVPLTSNFYFTPMKSL